MVPRTTLTQCIVVPLLFLVIFPACADVVRGQSKLFIVLEFIILLFRKMGGGGGATSSDQLLERRSGVNKYDFVQLHISCESSNI